VRLIYTFAGGAIAAGVALVAILWIAAFTGYFLVPGYLRWHHRAKWTAILSSYCSRCGYDLTGNVSGICSE
jgi:hypothetical protein